ncbi:hypothetical protein A2533_03260 [Candidatus Falkowbacteria bacterium RIFOXYD2_FULL_35_9]|uniref:Methyltransferase domain-containing protein n=1 Tax=Candidatus Falkowbacteria bacterium RIFOXYC2_FULL_36_12 TaxID=1798002 RepID=A0A1F5SVV3_9BACT|nr:MAG: hypothetical protein A2300_00735 [Candidatus Falkowbacteria bacterium RIFOXYB2_FULL_35_7]OGF30868.1 MAG: hypothetical protein A2478_00230 [Candidatus Falkowbacteria bacterium RIFOXYC2_FULL_36_12]OGF34247.1 MAG: hypothetical protein A2223_04590 [Candidatus Falkowbacteria bacterium RIFOXYA2_FULL_35_8]OGF48225.1 MAG: hypothetical protein A2533_03260 [Candidatus Falkowbacteria bacterium RIFOXYD2_FULL_35_9]
MGLTNYWNEQHQKYEKTNWITKPSLFIQSVFSYFPPSACVLELAAGQGADTKFMIKNGCNVVAVDISQYALDIAKSRIGEQNIHKVEFIALDIAEKLPFEDEKFDVVYSHLGLHYFSDKKTIEILKEIKRVLKVQGSLIMLVNTNQDIELGKMKMKKIEDNYYETETGLKKKYFSTDEIKILVEPFFEVVLLDNQGETYKDRAVGNANLIRLIGRKK